MSEQIISQEKLRKLQLVELEIFKSIKAICEKNNIRYYLSNGTLLGAMRHGGFIPWDDDMDICMPREDYNRFREIVEAELPDDLFSLDFRKRDSKDFSVGTMIKIASKNVIVKRHRGDGHMETTDNAWVDIFPLDGLPDDAKKRKAFGKRLKISKRMLSMAIWKDEGIVKQKTKKKQKVADIMTALHVPQILNIDRKKQRFRLDKLLQTYKYYESKYCINMLGDYELRETVPTALYGTPKTIMFEGVEANCPENADAVLRIVYGDYMQFPPKEEQICKHLIDIIEVNV